MNDLENELAELGIKAADITVIVDLFEQRTEEIARAQAAHLLRLIFLRVERDSPAGCALRRALGFSGEASFSRAAKDFCCTKQHLHALQKGLIEQLGDLRFVAMPAPVAVDPGALRQKMPTPVAGPSRKPRVHR